MARAYVLHENDAWVEPLRAAFAAEGVPHEEWFLDQGTLDIDRAPPDGVFYNRMSASSHTRDHRYAAEYTAGLLAWLESHGRRVINSGRALQLEISKVAQYAALNAHGIRTPRTLAAVGRVHILDAAARFEGPVIVKHNRGGKGLGVRLFRDRAALARYVDGGEFEPPIDGITLVQDYIQAPEPFITRAEFVGGRFLYALRVDTTDGFELCPADACRTGDAFCPTTPSAGPRFRVDLGFDHPILERYERFLSANGVEIAGIEFIADRHGEIWTYDVNTNTNYNAEAEAAAQAPLAGMRAIARYLGGELDGVYGKAARRELVSA
ncbi:MAG TPA: alpha-L-glutamate ligase [Alphaproteobacteria bacterium]|nr:alpha-L-glutamate ligase [Alphaproteobacteria bacterium]